VALLLCVSSIAAACELSCSLAANASECHSQAAQAPGAATSTIRIDSTSMAMDGMAMPDMPGSDDQQAVSATVPPMAGHPSIGEMGSCERQSCESGSAISASGRSSAWQYHSALAACEIDLVDRASFVTHSAREDVATHFPRDAMPTTLSLRI
jgi:hypothetical protein